MEYRTMHGTGLDVSEICLGAMTFGREADEETSHAILDRFVEGGGNFIDTANGYSDGASEEIIGRWLAGKHRDDLVIATKVFWDTASGPNRLGLSRKHILASVDASLHRLNTDYIDLFQVHYWDERTPIGETLSTLDGLVRAGKVRYLGASNFRGFQLQHSIDIVNQRNLEPFRCFQPLYNVLDRAPEWEMIPVCQQNGLGVIPWSPLRGGWLSGKYRRGMAPPQDETRVALADDHGWSESWSAYANERTWTILDELFAVAEELGRTPAQVALNWLAHRPGVTAPIVGARDLRQLDDNLGTVGWTLEPHQAARLTKVSEPAIPEPYRMLTGPDRLLTGRESH